MIYRLILEFFKNPEHIYNLIYIRVRVDLYMQMLRKGLGFGSISSAWDVVYFKYPVTQISEKTDETAQKHPLTPHSTNNYSHQPQPALHFRLGHSQHISYSTHRKSEADEDSAQAPAPEPEQTSDAAWASLDGYTHTHSRTTSHHQAYTPTYNDTNST